MSSRLEGDLAALVVYFHFSTATVRELELLAPPIPLLLYAVKTSFPT